MDNVTSIRGTEVAQSPTKSDILTRVAAAFDAYVEKTGLEPEGYVLNLGGANQQMSCNWAIYGLSEEHGMAHAMMCRSIWMIQQMADEG